MRCLSNSSLVCIALFVILILQLYHSLPGGELPLPGSPMLLLRTQPAPAWYRRSADPRLTVKQANEDASASSNSSGVSTIATAAAKATATAASRAEGAMQMPPLLYGTAWKKERTAALVELAVRSGFRGIDTACQPKHYYEPGVGAALSKLIGEGVVAREDIFLQTKFTPLTGQDPNKVPYDKAAPLREQVQQSFQASKRNLGTSYLDSLLLHSPLPTPEQTLEAWRELEAIQRAGGARRLGVCNCYDLSVFKDLHERAEVKPTVLQNRFYRDSGYDVALRTFCREHNITYQSFWTLTANPSITNSPTVSRVAQKLSKTPAQVFFAFVRSQGITFLTGTTSQQHMGEDLAVQSMELEEADVQEIASLLK